MLNQTLSREDKALLAMLFVFVFLAQSENIRFHSEYQAPDQMSHPLVQRPRCLQLSATPESIAPSSLLRRPRDLL
jgi:hypothetical protein